YQRDNEHLVATGTLGDISLNINENGKKIDTSISGSSIDLDSKLGHFGFGIGTSDFKVGLVQVSIQDASKLRNIEVKDFGYTAKIAEDDKFANVEADYRVGQVLVN